MRRGAAETMLPRGDRARPLLQDAPYREGVRGKRPFPQQPGAGPRQDGQGKLEPCMSKPSKGKDTEFPSPGQQGEQMAGGLTPHPSLPGSPSVKQASGSRYSSGCSTGTSSTSGLMSMVLPSEELVSSSFWSQRRRVSGRDHAGKCPLLSTTSAGSRRQTATTHRGSWSQPDN